VSAGAVEKVPMPIAWEARPSASMATPWLNAGMRGWACPAVRPCGRKRGFSYPALKGEAKYSPGAATVKFCLYPRGPPHRWRGRGVGRRGCRPWEGSRAGPVSRRSPSRSLTSHHQWRSRAGGSGGRPRAQRRCGRPSAVKEAWWRRCVRPRALRRDGQPSAGKKA
jgi:hypothetical protein